jgi:hypothetical protein
VLGVVAGGDLVGSEVVVVGVELDDVPVGHDDEIVTNRAGGLGSTAASAELAVA